MYAVCMIRKDLWLRNDQVRFLRKQKGNMTEHIRLAIDEYINKLKIELLNVSKSQSK